jgi:hypothetical protein
MTTEALPLVATDSPASQKVCSKFLKKTPLFLTCSYKSVSAYEICNYGTTRRVLHMPRTPWGARGAFVQSRSKDFGSREGNHETGFHSRAKEADNLAIAAVEATIGAVKAAKTAHPFGGWAVLGIG